MVDPVYLLYSQFSAASLHCVLLSFMIAIVSFYPALTECTCAHSHVHHMWSGADKIDEVK